MDAVRSLALVGLEASIVITGSCCHVKARDATGLDPRASHPNAALPVLEACFERFSVSWLVVSCSP
jgi:hypothetical protein